jgi:hypothetical protein
MRAIDQTVWSEKWPNRSLPDEFGCRGANRDPGGEAQIGEKFDGGHRLVSQHVSLRYADDLYRQRTVRLEWRPDYPAAIATGTGPAVGDGID